MSVCGKFNPYFVCKCFQWFPLQIDVHVEPGVYAPGAVIDLGINVTNKSFRRVRNFQVQLIKVSAGCFDIVGHDFESNSVPPVL